MINIKMKACAGAAATIGAGEALASICLAGVVAAGWTEAGAGACACASNVGAVAAGLRSWADPAAPVAPVASAVGALHTCKCLRCVDGGIMIVWYDTGFPVWQMYLICPIMLLETSKPPESLEGILSLRHLWPTFLPVSMKWVWKFSIQHVLNVGQGLMESFQQMINFSTDALDMLHLQNNWAKSIRQEHRSKCISRPCCMRLTFQTKKSEYDFRNCWPLAHWLIGPLAQWPWVLISSPTYRPCGQWRSTFHCAPAKLEVFGKCEWNAWTHIARWHMHLSSQAQPRFSLGPSLEASRSFPQPEITAKLEKVRGNPGRRIMQCENTLESARYKNIKKDQKAYLAISVEKKLGSSGGCLASMHARF